jgi:hypothetical protein
VGISTFRIGQAALGELASLRREPGTVSAGPLTPADHYSDKDVSTTFVPSTRYDASIKASLAFNSFQLPLASISVVVTYFLFAFTACLRPSGYPPRPDSIGMGLRCWPSLASAPSEPRHLPMRPRVALAARQRNRPGSQTTVIFGSRSLTIRGRSGSRSVTMGSRLLPMARQRQLGLALSENNQ